LGEEPAAFGRDEEILGSQRMPDERDLSATAEGQHAFAVEVVVEGEVPFDESRWLSPDVVVESAALVDVDRVDVRPVVFDRDADDEAANHHVTVRRDGRHLDRDVQALFGGGDDPTGISVGKHCEHRPGIDR
jgi:hypothetical protein